MTIRDLRTPTRRQPCQLKTDWSTGAFSLFCLHGVYIYIYLQILYLLWNPYIYIYIYIIISANICLSMRVLPNHPEFQQRNPPATRGIWPTIRRKRSAPAARCISRAVMTHQRVILTKMRRPRIAGPGGCGGQPANVEQPSINHDHSEPSSTPPETCEGNWLVLLPC